MSFWNVSIRNERRVRATHVEMNSFGVEKNPDAKFFQVSTQNDQKFQKTFFWVFDKYLVSLDPEDVLVIGIGPLLIMGEVSFFWKMSSISELKKPRYPMFLIFSSYLVQMSPGDVLVIGKWPLLVFRKTRFFKIFLSVNKN